MKNYLLLSVLFLSLFSACNTTSNPNNMNFSSVVPSSTGGADEVMFVIPDNLFTTATKDVIDANFNGSYRVLPAEESKFTISKVQFNLMNSLMYRFRNIVLLANTSQESQILAMAKEVLSEAEFAKLESGEQKSFIVSNVWSKPQNVVFLFGNSEEDLQKTLIENGPIVQAKIEKTNLKEFEKIAFINGINGSLKKQWSEFHNIDLNIPTDYKLAENEGNFVSLRKDIDKGIIFIFFDVVYYDGEVPDYNRGIELRNERGLTYITGESKGSYMSTDSTLGFKTTKEVLDGVVKYETSGLWTMENDFMGGPFINQYIIDADNKRVIFLDGFIYAPGENKKKRYLRQIEAIFSTLVIQ